MRKSELMTKGVTQREGGLCIDNNDSSIESFKQPVDRKSTSANTHGRRKTIVHAVRVATAANRLMNIKT